MARGYNRTVAPVSIPKEESCTKDNGFGIAGVNAIHAKLKQNTLFQFKSEGNDITCFTYARPLGSGTNACCQSHVKFSFENNTLTYAVTYELCDQYPLDWRIGKAVTKTINTHKGVLCDVTNADVSDVYSRIMNKMEDVRTDNFSYAKANNDWHKEHNDAFRTEMKEEFMKVVTPEMIDDCIAKTKSCNQWFDFTPTIAVKVYRGVCETKAYGYVSNPDNTDKYVSFPL